MLDATPLAVSTTGTCPAVPAGVATTTLVSDHDTTDAAAVWPVASSTITVTVPGAVPKPDPEIVTWFPPASGPSPGDRPLISATVGGAGAS